MKQSESSEGITFYWVIPVFISACLLQPALYWAGEWSIALVLLVTSPIWLWGIFRFLAIRSESAMDTASAAVGEGWSEVSSENN